MSRFFLSGYQNHTLIVIWVKGKCTKTNSMDSIWKMTFSTALHIVMRFVSMSRLVNVNSRCLCLEKLSNEFELLRQS